MNCLCGQLIESKRKDAKFCSTKCRVANSRSVTDNEKDVTDKSDTTGDYPAEAIRAKLKELLEEDIEKGTLSSDIEYYMDNQDTNFDKEGRYWIPVRYQKAIDKI